MTSKCKGLLICLLVFLRAASLYAQDAEGAKLTIVNSPNIIEANKTKDSASLYHLSYSSLLPDSIISFAKRYLNSRYQGGGNGPDRFDCSGFTSFVFSHFGYNLERSSGGQVANGKELTRQDSLQKGDLVFYKGRNSRASRIGHVGMVTSVNPDGTFSFIHASVHSGVIIDQSDAQYYKSRYVTASRVLSQNTSSVMPLPSETIPIAIEPAVEKQVTPPSITKRHKVKKGETLFSIARQYGITVKQLKAWNDISKDCIHPGEKLVVAKQVDSSVSQKSKKQHVKQDEIIVTPLQELSQTTPTETTSSQAELSTVEKDEPSPEHRVTKGETLFSIAKQYGITVTQLKTWNDISGDDIQSGQKLVVTKQDKQSPSSSSKKYKKHTVKKGETLTSIAHDNGCTIKQLRKWNDILGDHLQIGQKLTIR